MDLIDKVKAQAKFENDEFFLHCGGGNDGVGTGSSYSFGQGFETGPSKKSGTFQLSQNTSNLIYSMPVIGNAMQSGYYLDKGEYGMAAGHFVAAGLEGLLFLESTSYSVSKSVVSLFYGNAAKRGFDALGAFKNAISPFKGGT